MSFSFSGIASGINTDSMIEQLLKLERVPYNKLETKKKDAQDFQQYFRTMNTKLNALKTAASELMKSNNFQLTSVKSSDESIVRISGSDSAITGNYSVEVGKLAKAHVIKSEAFQSDADASSLTGKTFEVDGESIKLEGKTYGEVLENLKNEINRKSDTLNASVVDTGKGEKTLVLTSAKTGKDFTIGKQGDAGDGPKISGDLAALKLVDSGDNLGTVQDAQDAEVKVNGLAITSASNEVKGVIEGVTLNLQKAGTSMVSVAQDTEKVVAKVKAMVTAFNEVRNLIRNNTGKGQILQGDAMLRQLDGELTDWMSGMKGGQGVLAEIGIEIDKGKSSGEEMTGEITFDEKKFKEMFEKNPEKVIAMFNQEKPDSEGVAVILDKSLQSWTSKANGIIDSRVKGYDSEISFITKSMEDMEVRLQNKEKQLKAQFVAMEVALAKLQNEQSWMTSQLNSLTASKK